MKKIYFLPFFLLCTFILKAQDNPFNSSVIIGSCLNPDEGTVDLIFDLNKNCPEADVNGVLPGTPMMGFHSGANSWGTIIEWNDPNAHILNNNGADSFLVTVDIESYYGMPYADLVDIQMVINNGFADPDDPWTIALRDSLDGDSFGDPTDCSDLILIVAQTPTCADLAQESSISVFSDLGDSESCVDAEDGLVRIDLDYALACPEGDPDMGLAGATALRLHSTADGWASSVEFDDPNAKDLVNNGSDNFSAIIDVQSYYGIALDDITEITFIANDAVDNPDNPWDVAFRDDRDGGFGGTEPCSDLRLIIAEAPACDLTTDVQDLTLQNSLSVSPNPFQNRAYLQFDNPNNKTFDLVITDMMGRVMRTMTNVTGERVLIERDNLTTGIFMATLSNENGSFATTKLIVK